MKRVSYIYVRYLLYDGWGFNLGVRTLIKWVYHHFGRHPFTSYQVLRGYLPYRVTWGAGYTYVHRAWKMGLLARENVKGNKYRYRITDWGIRYVKEGLFYREDEMRIKLLSYITQYDKISDKKWAAEALAPRLLQRFFPGRRAQDIDPYVDLPEAAYNASQILKRRIINETIEPDDEFAIQCLDDEVILLLVDRLMSQLYPDNYTYLDIEEFKKHRRMILEESITELRNPPKRVTIRGIGYNLPLKLKRRPEDDRPNRKDLEKLDMVIDKLEKLISIST